MKKPVLIQLFLFFFTSVLISAQPRIMLGEVSGSVEFRVNSDSKWQPAKAEILLESDFEIVTGFASSASIIYGNTKIELRALTKIILRNIEITISKEGTKKHLFLFELVLGRIRAEVMPEETGETVVIARSKTALCKAAGTFFEFDGYNAWVERGRALLIKNNGERYFVE
jgi:hypothetical protein